MRVDDVPEPLFRQMRTCQTAANEFLRQFWLAIYPPSSDAQTASSSNPALKAAKADTNDASNSVNHPKGLLELPARTMDPMSKWLRLRDEFLSSKSVTLIGKLLIRLKGVSIEVDMET